VHGYAFACQNDTDSYQENADAWIAYKISRFAAVFTEDKKLVDRAAAISTEGRKNVNV
jgi:hypothetical protein